MSKLLSYTVSSCRTAVRDAFATVNRTRFTKWHFVAPIAAFAFALACSEATQNPVAPTAPDAGAIDPAFAALVAGNGPGQCLNEDATDAGFINNVGTLNCVSEDVDISFATVTYYSVNGGAFTPLPTGQAISCVPGDNIRAVTSAFIQNNAQERYDLGLWINATPGGSALTGPSPECRHYNLVVGAPGVSNLDNTPDQCGDVQAGVLVEVPLDTLTLICPSGGATSLQINACAAWSNSTTGSNDRICPVPTAPTPRDGFAFGTTPGTTAKCRCEPLDIPVDVKSVLRIEKQTLPDGSTQSFDFTPTGTGYTTGFSLTDGQTNNSPPLSAGTFTVTETLPTGWTLGTPACHVTGSATAKTSTPITNGVSVALGAGEDITCVFTNTQAPQLTVIKACVPSTDAGHFNLQIDAATAGTGANVGCSGGTTGAVTSTVGTHTVGETAAGTTVLTDYTTAITGDCAANGTITLAAGDNKTCTITNTRKPTLTVNKVCVPSTDAGTFNLQIDATTQGTGANVGCTGGTTGPVPVSIAQHTVGETAAGTTVIGDYASAITGDCAANGTVTLAAGDNKVCTITNTRKATLTVNKVCVPSTDGGHFNLQVDANTAGTGGNVGCTGGTTGPLTVTASTHTVGETAAGTTVLTDYTTAITGDCAADGTVTLAAGDNKTCTITNTRNPRLTVNKVCVPSTDGGHFNLQIDATTAGTGGNVGCTGGTTGPVPVTASTHTVGETAAGTTVLTGYTTAITGDCAADGTVTLAAGDNKTCTITNTRKATLTVNKVCVPSTDAGTFNLQIDANTAGTGGNVGCTGGTTGPVDVSLSTHTVGETAAGTTVLTNYTTAITGDCATDGTVTLAAGETKTCTITNTRKPTLTVNKVCAPSTDAGTFNLQIDANTAGTGGTVGCTGGTTGPVIVTAATHTVGETAAGTTVLSQYTAVITGDCAADGTVTVAAGQNKVCTITNTKKARIIVDKVVIGGGAQSFDFSLTTFTNFALTDATAPFQSGFIVPGNYTVCELGLAVAWAATVAVNGSTVPFSTVDGTSGTACLNLTVGAGVVDSVVVTNTPPPGGGTRTIGYWKNHSSCAQSNGGQYARNIANGTPEGNLDFYLGGAGVQSIYPIGTITTLTCAQAWNLLSKNAINGDKRAGDPIYNMVAQLLGAKLNVAAGAGTCAALNTALADAQTLLAAIGFNGTGSYAGKTPTYTLTAAQKAQANTLNGILSSYNEGTLGGGCPTHV